MSYSSYNSFKEIYASFPPGGKAMVLFLLGVSPLGIVAIGLFLGLTNTCPEYSCLPGPVAEYIRENMMTAMILSMVGIGFVWMGYAVFIWIAFVYYAIRAGMNFFLKK